MVALLTHAKRETVVLHFLPLSSHPVTLSPHLSLPFTESLDGWFPLRELAKERCVRKPGNTTVYRSLPLLLCMGVADHSEVTFSEDAHWDNSLCQTLFRNL